MSSGYVHPRPITAVNRKGKQCWRRFCHVFAFVSQPDPHSGWWETEGMSRHLSNRIDNRGINMQRHVSGRFLEVRLYGWMLVHPHVFISKWWIKADFYLCTDLTISPLQWGWIFLNACMWEKGRGSNDHSTVWLKKNQMCVYAYLDVAINMFT